MSTASPAVQQVLAELNKALERIKPSIMADDPVNGLKLSAYLKENNLAPTAENFYNAIKVIFATLNWKVKPAKLVAQERLDKTEIIPVAPLLSEGTDFEARVRAGERADAQAKADAASIKQAKELINAYNPTTQHGYDARERMEKQSEWTAALNQAIAQKRNLQEFAKALAAAIEKRYRDRERAAERM